MGEPLASDVLTMLRRVDSPTLANAIEAFDVRDHTDGYASLELRCQYPHQEPMVGYAITCTADSTSPAHSRPSKLTDLFDAVHEAPKPSVVVIQHVGLDRSRSCMAGDVLCTTFRKLGAVGLATDGGIRDLDGIRERAPGFQVFAPGMVVSHGTYTVLEVNITVSICGLVVEPGDLLHGDANGLLRVPVEVAAQAARQAETVWSQEQEIIEFLQGEAFSMHDLRSLFRH